MKIVVLIGASGSGKTVLGKYLQTLGIKKLITHTTRSPREGEINGEDYHFISKEDFLNLPKLEFTYYAGDFYGISYNELINHKDEEFTYCILDYNGANIFKHIYDKNCIIVCVDVSYITMRKRMINRGDNLDEIEKRIKHSLEIKETENNISIADYVIPEGALDTQKYILNIIINKLKEGGTC